MNKQLVKHKQVGYEKIQSIKCCKRWTYNLIENDIWGSDKMYRKDVKVSCIKISDNWFDRVLPYW